MFKRKLLEIIECADFFYFGSWKERCPLAHDELPCLKGMYTRHIQFNRNHQYGMFLNLDGLFYRVVSFGMQIYILTCNGKSTIP